MSRVAGTIKMNSFEELFDDAMESDLIDGIYANGEIKEIRLEELHTFKNHPFKVLDDERMEELVESIKEKGVLTPAIVRKRAEGGYELISGHRRRRACELAGFSTMPVIVRKLEDDEATILMVDANIQREGILPSERARSLKMKLDAMKHQGKRVDLTLGQVGPKFSAEEVGEAEGISARQVKRYIRLNYLIPELMDLTDMGEIGFVQATDLSFVKPDDQKLIFDSIKETKKKIGMKQSEVLKQRSQEGTLDGDAVFQILYGVKKIERKIVFSERELAELFPDNFDEKQIKDKIVELIKAWKGED